MFTYYIFPYICQNVVFPWVLTQVLDPHNKCVWIVRLVLFGDRMKNAKLNHKFARIYYASQANLQQKVLLYMRLHHAFHWLGETQVYAGNFPAIHQQFWTARSSERASLLAHLHSARKFTAAREIEQEHIRREPLLLYILRATFYIIQPTHPPTLHSAAGNVTRSACLLVHILLWMHATRAALTIGGGWSLK